MRHCPLVTHHYALLLSFLGFFVFFWEAWLFCVMLCCESV